MKPKNKNQFYTKAPITALSLMTSMLLTNGLQAADRNWTGSTSAAWNVAGNWSGGIPTTADVAVFNSSSANLTTTLGANQSVLGVRISDPSGAVSIGGNTLTLGASGLDLSSATQNLTISSAVTLIGARAQTWSVPASGTLTVSGTLTATAGAALNVSVASGGTVKLTSGTASTLLGTYSTFGTSDWAVKNAANTDLVGGASVSGFYTANTTGTDQTPGANADMSVYNTGWAGGQVRFGTNRTATTMRFNGGTGGGATGVEQKSGTATTISGILVTPNYGAKDVNFTTGGFRPTSSGSLYLHQNNTSGNLVFQSGLTANGTNTLIKTGAGRVIISNADGLTSTHTITEGTLQYGNNGTTGSITTTSLSVVNHGNLQFNRTDAVTLANPISGTGEFTQAGSGILTLSGTNTYTGATVAKAGTLTYSTGLTNFGSGTVIRFEGGSFQWPSGNTTDISSRTLTFTGGAGFDTNGNNVTLANSIGNGGVGGLTKSGLGTLELTAANSYSGNTSVNAGTLKVSNSTSSATGSGNITVASGAQLTGAGSVSGSVTINSTATIVPGNAGVGTLTAGGLTLANNAAAVFEFGSSSNDTIQLTTADAFVLNGGVFTLYDAGTTTGFDTPGTYSLIQYNGAIGGTGLDSSWTTASYGNPHVANPVLGYDYAFVAEGGWLKLIVSASAAPTNQWITDGNGTWSNSASWSTSSAPSGQSSNAAFTTALSQASTISLDSNRTIGILSFDSTNGYTISSSNDSVLSLDNGTSASTVTVTSGSHSISAATSFLNDSAFSINTGASLAISGATSGSGNLSKSGAGNLSLTGTSTATGNVTVTEGTLTVGSDSLPAGSLSINGATLQWADASSYDVSNSRTVSFGSFGATLNTNGNSVTLASALDSTVTTSLTKTGAGTLVLNGVNTFDGTTSVQSGTLQISNDSALGDIPAVTTPGSLSIGNATFATSTTLALNSKRGISLSNANAAVNIADGTVLTYAGIIAGSGTLNLTGTGALTISGANSYTGGTVLNAGSKINWNGGTMGTGTINMKGGTIDININNGGTLNTVNVASGETGNIYGYQTRNTLNVLTGAGTLNLYSGSGGNNATSGANAFRLNNLNAYTGTINLRSTTASVNTFTMYFNGGTFNGMSGTTLNLSNYARLSGVTGSGGNAVNIAAVSGDSTAILSGSDYAGAVTYQVGAKNSDEVFAGVINNGSNTGAGTAIVKNGTGSWTLSGTNTYTGATTINAGSIIATNSASLGATPSVTIAGNNAAAHLRVSGNSTLTAPFTLNMKNSAATTQSSIVNTSGNNTLSGNITGTTGGNYLAIESASDTLTLSGNFTHAGTGARPLTLTGAGNGISTGVISDGAGVVSIEKTGSGTWSLNGANTYTGDTKVTAGTLSLGQNALADTADVYITTGATLNLNYTGNDAVDQLYIDNALQSSGTYGSLTSSATNKVSWITGNGVLYVGVPITVPGFNAWATAAGLDGTTGKESGPSDDPDRDGVTNLMEFVLDGNPLSASAAQQPTQSVTADALVLSFKRRDDSESTVIQTVQYSTDLNTWNDIAIGASSAGAVTITENDAAADDVSVSVPKSGNSSLFVRLKVQQTP